MFRAYYARKANDWIATDSTPDYLVRSILLGFVSLSVCMHARMYVCMWLSCEWRRLWRRRS